MKKLFLYAALLAIFPVSNVMSQTQPPAGGMKPPPPPAGGMMPPPAGGTMQPPAGGTMQAPRGPLPVLTSCNINGMQGIMNVKDPKPLRPTPPAIQFIDMASNRQQESLWNLSSATLQQQGLTASIACLNNQPTDIATMPQGVQCQMLTNNPAPNGGGAVLIVSCYSGTGGGGGQQPPNTSGTQQR
jgi:hypothetical protein